MKATTLAAAIIVAALLFLILAIFIGKPLLACYVINGLALAANAYLVAAHFSFTRRAKNALTAYKASVDKLREALK